MAYEFYLGLDAETSEDETTSFSFSLVEKNQEQGELDYRLHDLTRLEIDQNEMVDTIQNRISEDPFVGRTVCVVNVTEAVGRALHGALNNRGLSPVAVSISGGDAATQSGSGFDLEGGDTAGSDEGGLQASEHDVVSTVENLYHEGRIDTNILKTDEISELTRGLDQYRMVAKEPGQEGLESIDVAPGRSSENADLVIATGIACWLAEQHSFDPTEHLAGEAPPMNEAKREMRPDTT